MVCLDKYFGLLFAGNIISTRKSIKKIREEISKFFENRF